MTMHSDIDSLIRSLPQQRYIIPSWPAPANVLAVSTKRDLHTPETHPLDGFNLSYVKADHPSMVTDARRLLRQNLHLNHDPSWLHQTHSNQVVSLSLPPNGQHQNNPVPADASVTKQAQVVCAVMTADCLPVLICDKQGTQVAAVHAGWRGLANNIIEQTLSHFSQPEKLLVWLGPAIGPDAFEVGEDVRQVFINYSPEAAACFKPALTHPYKYLANLYALAKMRLHNLGITHIYGGDQCTFVQANEYYSHRRNPDSGRQASLITLL